MSLGGPLIASADAPKTVGWSPKSQWALIAPVLLGVALLLADKLLLGDDITDEVWLGILLGGPTAGAAAYQAGPGRVVRSVSKEQIHG